MTSFFRSRGGQGIRTLAVSLFVSATGLRAGADAIRYTVTDIGTLPGDTSSQVYAINNLGQVVGRSFRIDPTTGRQQDTAFLYSDGRLTSLGSGWVRSINDLGQVGADGASGINSSGQIVGYGNTTSDATVRNPDGSTINLGRLEGGYSEAVAINDAGQVVGYASVHGQNHPFLYSGGQMLDLGLLPGSSGASAYAINSSGQVVGGGGVGSNAFLFDGRRLLDLGNLGGDYSVARGINDHGQIVGLSSLGPPPLPGHAFLYDGGKMLDLNSLIDPALGVLLVDAKGINNAGQIAAEGIIDGQDRAFLLTPTTVPEPSTLLIVGLGGGALLLASKRRESGKMARQSKLT